MTQGKAKAGDPLQIPAAQWNRMIDATKQILSDQLTGTGLDERNGRFANMLDAERHPRFACCVIVHDSDEGETTDFDAMKASEFISNMGDDGGGSQASDDHGFALNYALNAKQCEEEDDAFVIVPQPMVKGDFGVAICDGQTFAKVEIKSLDHKYVRPKIGTYKLETADSGYARLIARKRDDIDAESWCFIQLGVGGGGAGASRPGIVSENVSARTGDQITGVAGTGKVDFAKITDPDTDGTMEEESADNDVWNWGSNSIDAGTWVLCNQDPDGLWWVAIPDCEPETTQSEEPTLG